MVGLGLATRRWVVVLALAAGVSAAAFADPDPLPIPTPPAALPAVPVAPPTAEPVAAPALTPAAPASPPAASPAPAGPPAASSPKFDFYWNNGLFIQSRDTDFTMHFGGVVHYDGAWYRTPAGQKNFPDRDRAFVDGVTPRRLRLLAEGTLYKNVDYMAYYEFANGFSSTVPATPATTFLTPGPLDMWVTVKDVPFVGNVRIGNQKEPFSLEHLNDARYLEFLERSYLFDFSQNSRFNNGRNPGVSVFRTWADDRVYSAVGVFKNNSNLFGYGIGDGDYAVTGRVTALPVYCPEDERMWHVGGAMSHRDPVDGKVLVSVRNSVRSAPLPLLPLIALTDPITATSQDLCNLETAATYGRWTVQAEYTTNFIHNASVGKGPNVGTLLYQGYYVEGMCFLTGEHRTWNPQSATFNRVIPKTNFAFEHGTWCVKGWGAWELAARYQYLDCDDKGINGGVLNDVTLGVNWYWNPNTKMQFNYDYVYREGGIPDTKGGIHSFGTRIAYDF